MSGVTVGVLALQGAYKEHMAMLAMLPGVAAVEVTQPEHLLACDGIIIPGGESTVIGKLCFSSGLLEPLKAWTKADRPSWGTCAGLIMLANDIEGATKERQELIGGLDCVVRRNYFGSQAGSFSQEMEFPDSAERGCTSVFIRAPAVMAVGQGVKVLSTVSYQVRSKEAFDQEGKSVIVAVQQGNLMGTAFHPELVPSDLRWHQRFVDVVRQAKH